MIKQSIKRLIISAKMITLILLVFMTAYVGTDLFAGREACAAQPHFETINGHKVLMVNDKPFLLLGVEGEGAASTSNQSEILSNLGWAGDNNCNVFKACVSWRWMEPSKDSYSFAFLDQVISKARSYNIKVHIVYIGFNRIGEAERYVPDYIQSDETTYQRVVDSNDQSVDWWGKFQLCANDPDTLSREKKMVEAMMTHLYSTDSQDQTVVAVQIQNEPAIYGISRCHCSVCNDLRSQGTHSNDEEFYAWSIAHYIEELAKAGKAIYDIPCNVNAILATSTYLANAYKYRQLYLDTAPHIDLIGPDKYATSMSDLRSTLNQYNSGRNIIYVAETSTDQTERADFFIYQILGEFGGIGQSAWSVNTCYPNANTSVPYDQGSQAGLETTKAYKAIGAAMSPIAIYQSTQALAWFVPNAATSFTETVNDLTLSISTANDKGKGIIVQPTQGEMDFTLVGNDYTVELPDLVPSSSISAEKGKWDGSTWMPIENVAFDRNGGYVIVTMPESCAVRVYSDNSALSTPTGLTIIRMNSRR